MAKFTSRVEPGGNVITVDWDFSGEPEPLDRQIALFDCALRALRGYDTDCDNCSLRYEGCTRQDYVGEEIYHD